MENNAKHFALQLGALISLYVSIAALIQLLFGIITLKFPDELSYVWEQQASSSSVRWGIAILIVALPTYIGLTRVVNVSRRRGETYLSFTKWLIYLSLVVGGIVLLGDLITIIYNFLNGELTTVFLLKALTVLGVVGAAFAYYVYDARGYWQTHEAESKRYGMVVALLALVAIVFGYMSIESPQMVREREADTRAVNDLGIIQAAVMNQYALTNTLPSSLDEIPANETLPTAPLGRDAYRYNPTGAKSFELCAEFAYDSSPEMYPEYYSPADVKYGELKNPYDWTYQAGNWCFTRVIN